MASKPTTNLTARDAQILSVLIKTPLDARQLLKLSLTFDEPFTCDRVVRRRLQNLVDYGLVSCFSYAMPGVSSLNYYKVTPAGYRLVQGPQATLPSRAFFREVSLSLQEHTRALADFIVHIHTSAMVAGVEVESFYRENQLQLTLNNRKQQPDCAFQLRLQTYAKWSRPVDGNRKIQEKTLILKTINAKRRQLG